MRRLVINTVLSGLLFGYLVTLFFFLLIGWAIGWSEALRFWLQFGSLAALFWIVCVGLLMISQKRKARKMCLSIESRTPVLLDGGASHWRGKINDGGWLFLTKEGLLFKPHAVNLSWQDVWIPSEMIVGAHRYNNLGIMPNGLLLELKNGAQEKFVVNWPSEWVRMINNTSPYQV